MDSTQKHREHKEPQSCTEKKTRSERAKSIAWGNALRYNKGIAEQARNDEQRKNMKKKSFFKKIFRIKTIVISLITIILLSIILMIFADKKIAFQSKKYLYNDVIEIPENKVGLVLGTSKFLSNGQINLYYQHRIEAAVALYKAGKIRYIVVSGDNSRKTYDEPTQMKNDLVARGVPENVIYLDYAGFRTWDSVVRIKEIFSQSHFTIITQRFHNERAIYLAHRYGLNVVGFNAKDVDKYYGFKTNLREKFARVKVFVDFFTNKKPKFLGEKIEIESYQYND